MKVTKKTAKAVSAAKAKFNAGKAVKLNGKSNKITRRNAKAAKREAYKGLTGDLILIVSGSKGELFRRATVSKDGFAKLTHCAHRGIKYDGKTVDLVNLGDNDRETKRELGTYVAGRGSQAEVRAVSLSTARGLCKHKVSVERHNGKTATLHVTRKDAQYAGSREQFNNGEGFGQWESKRLAHNKSHFGAIVKG